MVNPVLAEVGTPKKYAFSGSYPVNSLNLPPVSKSICLVPEKPGLYPNARPKVFNGTLAKSNTLAKAALGP